MLTKKKRITVKDVAEAAGVSTQTVSRVVNNHPDVAPDTFQRVQQIIKETGYAPNVLARSLIQGHTNTLGVVAYGIKFFGPARVLTGIEQQAAEMGYSIFLNLIHEPETDNMQALLDNLSARQVDGIIWAVPEIGRNRQWTDSHAAGLHIPTIFVSGMEQPTTLPLVGVDNYAIGCLATEHLLAGGARRVGIITGPWDWWEARQREQGWRETLEAHGLQPQPKWSVAGDWTATSGEQSLYQLLAQFPDIDAVFASNDQMALGVLHAAHRLGKRIPEDLSIVGVDNMPEAAHFWPPLTTVRQHLLDSGGQVVRELDKLIKNTALPRQDPAAPAITLLQPELIIRESSRPVLNRPA